MEKRCSIYRGDGTYRYVAEYRYEPEDQDYCCEAVVTDEDTHDGFPVVCVHAPCDNVEDYGWILDHRNKWDLEENA